MPGIFEDRRKWPRVPVQLWIRETRERELYFQRAANLGKGGVFLENTIPHPFGTFVNLEFSIPGRAEAVRLRGRIVSLPGTSSDLGMGVEFVDLDPSIGRLLDDLVENQASRFGTI